MRIPTFFLFVLLLSIGSSALVNGCIKYTVDSNKQLRCIYCFYNMGLTSANTCELCKTGFTVVQGTCQPKPGSTNTAQVMGFTGYQTKQTQVLPSVVPAASSVSNINIQSAQSSYFFTLNNKKPNNTTQGSTISSFASFGQVSSPQAASAPVVRQEVPNCERVGSDGFCQKCKDNFILNNNKGCDEVKNGEQPGRKNCFMFQTMSSKCLQCKSNYVLTQSGVCIQAKLEEKKVSDSSPAKINQTNSAVLSSQFSQLSSLQSFEPSRKYSQGESNINQKQTNQYQSKNSLQSFEYQPNDNQFGFFGVPTSLKDSDQHSSANTNKLQVSTNASNKQNNLASTSSQSNNNKAQQAKPIVHKYPQFPYCIDYAFNSCWACVPGYLLNLIIDECTPYIKPVTNISKPIQKSSTESKTDAAASSSSNCDVFSQQKQVCEECYRNYYLDKAKKLCLPVDQLCRTYDQDNGKCKSCYTNYALTSQGKCVKKG